MVSKSQKQRPLATRRPSACEAFPLPHPALQGTLPTLQLKQRPLLPRRAGPPSGPLEGAAHLPPGTGSILFHRGLFSFCAQIKSTKPLTPCSRFPAFSRDLLGPSTCHLFHPHSARACCLPMVSDPFNQQHLRDVSSTSHAGSGARSIKEKRHSPWGEVTPLRGENQAPRGRKSDQGMAAEASPGKSGLNFQGREGF